MNICSFQRVLLRSIELAIFIYTGMESILPSHLGKMLVSIYLRTKGTNESLS